MSTQIARCVDPVQDLEEGTEMFDTARDSYRPFESSDLGTVYQALIRSEVCCEWCGLLNATLMSHEESSQASHLRR